MANPISDEESSPKAPFIADNITSASSNIVSLPPQYETQKAMANFHKDSSDRWDKQEAITGFKVLKSDLSPSDEIYTKEYTLQPHREALGQPVIELESSGSLWLAHFPSSVCGRVIITPEGLYATTYQQGLYQMNLKDGKVLSQQKLWSQPLGDLYAHQDLVVVPQRNGNISAYSTATLERRWNSRSAVNVSPGEIDISISRISIHPPYLYVSKHWGNLYVLKADSGRMLADPGVPYESRITTPAVVAENTVIYSNVAGELHGFSRNGLERQWEMSLPKGYATAMIMGSRLLYIATDQRQLIALDLQRREVVWARDLAGHCFQSLAWAQNTLVVGAQHLYAFDGDGHELWKLHNEGPSGMCRGPAILDADGLFMASQEGEIVQFEPLSVARPRQVKAWKLEGEIWNPLAKQGPYLAASNNRGDLLMLQIVRKKP